MLSRSDGKACPDQGIEHVPGEFVAPAPTWTNNAEFDALATLHPRPPATKPRARIGNRRRRPHLGRASAWKTAEIERLNAQQRSTSSWSLPVADGACSRVLVVDVDTWMTALELFLATEPGRQAIDRHGTSRETVLAIAVAMVSFAEGTTGRWVTASNTSIGKRAHGGKRVSLSARTVRRVRPLLAEIGFAEELERGRHMSPLERAAAWAHHGNLQEGAASVWCLTMPRPVMTTPRRLAPRRRPSSLRRVTRCARLAAGIPTQLSTGQEPQESRESTGHGHGGDCGHLSSPTSVGGDPHLGKSTSFPKESFVEKKSPTRARAHAKAGKKSRKRTKKRIDQQDRPLHLQREAARLANRITVRGSVTLSQWLADHRIHIGTFCDLLLGVGIDTARWAAHDVQTRLEAAAREAGLDWPRRINNPLAFLRLRLAQVDWSGPSPSQLARSPWTLAGVSDHHGVTVGPDSAVGRPESPARNSRHPRTDCMLCAGSGWLCGADGQAVEPLRRCACPTDVTEIAAASAIAARPTAPQQRSTPVTRGRPTLREQFEQFRAQKQAG